MKKFFVITLMLLHTFISASEKEKNILSESERFNALKNLNWQKSGIYDLPFSNSTIHLPEAYCIVTGNEAYQAMEYMGNPGCHATEAVVYGDNFKGAVIFMCHNSGYVSLRDWESINPDQLLSDIKKGTEFDNKERLRKGMATIDIIGWIQKPILDRNTSTVYWAIEGMTFNTNGSKELYVNSTALKMKRNGYEKIIWITNKNLYIPRGGKLELMLKAHNFNPGFDYGDYALGDMVSNYGIAALIAHTLGAKVVQSPGLLFFLKKIWFLIVAALAALIYKIKNFLRLDED